MALFSNGFERYIKFLSLFDSDTDMVPSVSNVDEWEGDVGFSTSSWTAADATFFNVGIAAVYTEATSGSASAIPPNVEDAQGYVDADADVAGADLILRWEFQKFGDAETLFSFRGGGAEMEAVIAFDFGLDRPEALEIDMPFAPPSFVALWLTTAAQVIALDPDDFTL